MKRKMMLGLGSALACLAMVGCQAAGTRGTSTASAGNAWNNPVARANTPIGKPTPVANSQSPNLGSPTPANQVSPATLRPPVPGNFPAPSDPNGFGAPAPLPGAPAIPNFAPPNLDPPAPAIPNSQINNSLHPTPPGLPQPVSGIPNLPPPPPPIVP